MSQLTKKLRQMAKERRHASVDPAILREAADAIEEREEAAIASYASLRALLGAAHPHTRSLAAEYSWLTEDWSRGGDDEPGRGVKAADVDPVLDGGGLGQPNRGIVD